MAGSRDGLVSVYSLPSKVTLAVYVRTPSALQVASVVTSLVTAAFTVSTWEASLPQVKVAEAVKSSFHFHTGAP